MACKFGAVDIPSAYMQMVNRRKTIKELQMKLEAEMPVVFFERDLRKQIEDEQKESDFSDSSKARLLRSARRLEVKWNTPKKFGELRSYATQNVEELDVLAAWSNQKSCYLSHYSALYFNELIEQRPKDYFVTCERRGKSAGPSTPLKPLNVKQAFLKPPRKTQNYFEFKKSKFYLLEKLWLDSAGVITKQYPAQAKEVTIRLTSVERTLLDSLISPHYSGGIATVMKAYSSKTLDVEALKTLYRKISPIYPYWQSIGFVLEKLGKVSEADLWEKWFRDDKAMPFFLEHEAKSYWKHSERWNLTYPGGVFGEA